MKEMINNLMGEGGILSKYIPGYQVRPPQIAGVEAMLNSIVNKQHFILEGPCGYGKSPTYLISAMLNNVIAKQSGIRDDDIAKSGIGRTVIVTAGITLQEQLYYKDMPEIASAIEEATGIKVSYSHLKGRNNFLCRNKMEIMSQVTVPGIDKELDRMLKWYDKTKTGDLSELDYIPPYEYWKESSCVDPSDCEGKNCPYYNECFYQKRKIKSKLSDIVVTNYHVLFSDIIIGPDMMDGGGKLLGNYDLLVCDEAHEMAKIARDFLEVKISYYTFLNIQNKLTSLNKKHNELFDMAVCGVNEIVEYANHYFRSLTEAYPMQGIEKNKLIARGTTIAWFDFGNKIAEFKNRVEHCRERVCPYGEEDTIMGAHNKEDIFKVLNALDSIVSRCEDIMLQLKDICEQEDEERSYWFELENNGMLSLHSKPVKVNDFLNYNIFAKNGLTTVITSATLSVNNGFDYIKTELGIEQANEMIAPSPFDMKNQQLWYLPANAVEGNTKEFGQVMIEQICEVIEACRGGVLGLFTSIASLNYATRITRNRFPEYTIYKQGELPRQLLLQNFANEPNSILFGTKSFFTGVDVKGPSLRCVIIDKLPFESPGDPIMSVLSREPNGFMKYFIPDMIIAYKQAVGRGVRTVTDKCVIVTLDNRMATARYKARIGNSFNYDKTATRDIKDVKRFIDDYIRSLPPDIQNNIENDIDDLPF